MSDYRNSELASIGQFSNGEIVLTGNDREDVFRAIIRAVDNGQSVDVQEECSMKVSPTAEIKFDATEISFKAGFEFVKINKRIFKIGGKK